MIRERVEIGGAGSTGEGARAVRLVPGHVLVSCDRADCDAALDGAAWVVEGRRPSGEAFSVRVPLDAARTPAAQPWTGTCDGQPFTRHEWTLRPLAPTADVGDVAGPVRVHATFADASWTTHVQPGETAGAATYARGSAAPFCAAGRQVRASARLVVVAPASALRTTVEMFPEPALARAHDLVRLFVRANGDDGTGPAPYPENGWNVRFRQPVLDTGSYNEDLYGGRFESWNRGGFRFRAFQLTDSSRFQSRTVLYSYARTGQVHYAFDQPLPFTYEAGSTDLLTVPVAVTLSTLQVGPTLDVAVRAAWFETETARPAIAAGQSTTLRSHATDALGRLDAAGVRLKDPNTTLWGVFRVWAYPANGADPVGDLVNDRTGERDPYGVTASVADLASGAIRFEAYPPGPPVRHAAERPALRPRWRRTGPLERHPMPVPLEPWEWTAREGGTVGPPAARRSDTEVTVYLDVEAYAYLIYSGAELRVEPALAVTADPDTLSAGDEASFTVDAPGLDLSTSITFSVPDLSLGGFVAGGGPRQTTATTTLGGVPAVRFRATDTAPDSASTVAVTVETGGRTGTVDLTVRPAPVVRLLAQNDEPVADDYVMVSYVRPDWLLPATVGFTTSTGRTRAHPNDAEPDTSDFDPRTYRAEVGHLPDSLEALGAQLRFRYTVSGPGHNVTMVLDGTDVRRDPTNGLRARSRSFVRLVSQSRPALGAMGSCDPWPPAPPPAPPPPPTQGGDCLYDDEVVPGQTLLARLGDSLRVEAFVVDGSVERPIGEDAFRVGQAATESGVDAVRRVHLVWQQYRRRDGGLAVAYPRLAVPRVNEVWAPASIRFVNEAVPAGTDTVFTAAGMDNVLSLRMQGNIPSVGTLRLLVRVGADQDTVDVPLTAGASLDRVALYARYYIMQRFGLVDDEMGNFVDGTQTVVNGVDTTDVAVRRLLVIRQPGSASIRVAQNPFVNLRIVATMTPLESVPKGSQAMLAVAMAHHDRRHSTLDVFVVPDRAIAYGDSLSIVGARATNDGDIQTPSIAFVSEDAADGDDQTLTVALSHELGHVLLVEGFPGGPGGAECNPEQVAFHHPAFWNLMYCVTPYRGARIGGPRRLTPAQQREARCESGSSADAVAPSDCPTGYDADRSSTRALLRPDL